MFLMILRSKWHLKEIHALIQLFCEFKYEINRNLEQSKINCITFSVTNMVENSRIGVFQSIILCNFNHFVSEYHLKEPDIFKIF